MRERMDRWLERGILALVLLLLVVAPVAWGAVQAREFLLLQFLTCGALGLWLARLWVSPKPVLLWPPLCWAALAFVAYALFRCQSHLSVPYAARQEFIQTLVYAALFFVALNNLHRQETVRILVFTLVTVAFGISVFALYQFVSATGSAPGWMRPEIYARRAGGTFVCPNHLAGFLELLLPLALTYTLIGRLGHVPKIVLGYIGLVLLLGLGVTVSRGGWLAAAITLAGVFALLLAHRGYRLRALLSLAGLTLLIALLAFQENLAYKRLSNTFQESAPEDIRFQYWQPALKIWKETPWLGAGPGHFNYLFPKHRPPDVQMNPDYVHNEYLNTLSDWGMIGLGLVAAFWALFFVSVMKTWPAVRRKADQGGSGGSNKAAFILGGTAGIVSLLLHSVMDFNFHIPALAALAMVFTALIASHVRFATDQFWVRARLPLRLGVTVLGGVLLAYLTGQGLQQAEVCRWVTAAERCPTNRVQQIASMERGFQADPSNPRLAYAIGERYRRQAREAGTNAPALLQHAMKWFEQTQALNPHDALSHTRYGMCLDRLKQHDAARKYYETALQLDPNHHEVLSGMGWHQVQIENYADAKTWFEKSLRNYSNHRGRNDFAYSYLLIVMQRLADADPAPPKSPPPG